MRIGLFGIGGVYNYGCEAIVRGTTAFLKLHDSNCDIVYYTFNYEYDKSRLSDLDISIIPVKPNNSLLKKIKNKFMWHLQMECCELFYDYQAIIDDVDMLFFIGGDIYTIPAVERKKEKYRYVNSLVEFGKKAVGSKVPVVLYGASVGPFGDYKKADDYYRKALKSYKAIICREQEAIDYLQGFSLGNVYFSPDPAFLVGISQVDTEHQTSEGYVASQSEDNTKPIGINFSPLSLSEVYENGEQSEIGRILDLLRNIQNYFQRDIILFPHVISEDKRDNDLAFMQEVIDLMNDHEKKHYKIADYEKGFLGVKSQLKECDMVVSARMHCAINAIHENIPTILLSYSQKSIGMCEYVYNSKKWVVDIRDMEKKLIPTMKEMLDCRNQISKLLIRRNQEITQSIQENTESIRKLLFMEG